MLGNFCERFAAIYTFNNPLFLDWDHSFFSFYSTSFSTGIMDSSFFPPFSFVFFPSFISLYSLNFKSNFELRYEVIFMSFSTSYRGKLHPAFLNKCFKVVFLSHDYSAATSGKKVAWYFLAFRVKLRIIPFVPTYQSYGPWFGLKSTKKDTFKCWETSFHNLRKWKRKR